MAAIWTWYRPWQALSFASGQGGWQVEYDYPIFPPESLQRIIFRCELAGSTHGYGASTLTFPQGGLIIARIIVATDTDSESAALITRGISQTYGTDLVPNGTSMNYFVLGVHSPIELDFEYRKLSPPPPGGSLG